MRLHEPAAAAALMDAIERFAASGKGMPRDLGGAATTRDVTDTIIALIERKNV